MTADFTGDPDARFPTDELTDNITRATGPCDFIEATKLATRLLGDSIAANMFMVGYAYQKGYLPVSSKSIEAAIELNGVAVDFNRNAFLWGRRTAHDATAVAALVKPKPRPGRVKRPEEDTFFGRRVSHLTDYQNAAYARRYADLVERAREAERTRAPGLEGFADAVERGYFKVLAIKDEYEVARLYTNGRFEWRLRERFGDHYKLRFHLAPPLLAARDPRTGHLIKREFGGWMMTVFRLLAKLKALRGTPFDLFGRTAERRAERRLVTEYEKTIERVIAELSPDNHAIACDLAGLPLQIRGFGHVKQTAMETARACEQQLMAEFESGGDGTREAAE